MPKDKKKVAVFKTGLHTDASGVAKEWSEQDLQKIANLYDGTNHTAPIVIGHPTTNAPAYGWVDALSYADGVLYADFKEVNDDLVDAINSGAYKKRSISLYPDMSLRHVGILGATPPAVKGLPDFSFSEAEHITIDYEDATPSFANAFNFADALEAKDKAIAELRAQIVAKEDEEKRLKIESFVDTQIAAGRLTQAQKELVVNIGVICSKVRSYDFSEELKAAVTTENFEGLFASLPVRVEFGEFAKQDGASKENTNIDDREALHLKVLSFSESEKVPYETALNTILKGAK